MRVAASIVLTEDDRARLGALSRSRRAEARVVERAKMILLAAEGLQHKQIAALLACDYRTVGRWRKRFREKGVEGLLRDAPRPGAGRRLSKAMIGEVVRVTIEETPPNATHWSTRTMAKRFGVGHEMIRRIWRAHGLKPHVLRGFKVSRDLHFVEKLEDVVGLYLHPPEHAIVFSVDEKSQIQALDRTQPGLPMKRGRAGTMTHDYKRNGTTTLFSALNTLDGTVIGECMPRHRHQEYLRFLRRIDREVARDLDIHIIVDNYSAHKHKKVKRWLTRHRRFHIHFTPTSSSWLNIVERFFGEITRKRIRRGVFHSVDELITAIMDYIDAHNRDPKPFVWTKSARDILAKVVRARDQLNKYSTT